jgi:hypothetical protein
MAAKRIRDFVETTELTLNDDLIVDKESGTYKTKLSTLIGFNHPHGAADITGLTSAIDTEVSTVIQNAQSIANYWSLLGVTYKKTDLGNVTGNVSIDLALSMYHTFTVTGAVTLTFTNVKTGSLVSNVALRIVNGGAFTVTFPASVKFPEGTAPTLTTSGTDILNFISDDNGTNWYNVGQVLDLK